MFKKLPERLVLIFGIIIFIAIIPFSLLYLKVVRRVVEKESKLA